MPHRLIALFAAACFALTAGGCESFSKNPKPKHQKKPASKKQYEEVLMPLQTGSTLQRRTYVPVSPDSERKPTKKKKKEAETPKTEAKPSATPAPEEESTPPPDRFR